METRTGADDAPAPPHPDDPAAAAAAGGGGGGGETAAGIVAPMEIDLADRDAAAADADADGAEKQPGRSWRRRSKRGAHIVRQRNSSSASNGPIEAVYRTDAAGQSSDGLGGSVLRVKSRGRISDLGAGSDCEEDDEGAIEAARTAARASGISMVLGQEDLLSQVLNELSKDAARDNMRRRQAAAAGRCCQCCCKRLRQRRRRQRRDGDGMENGGGGKRSGDDEEEEDDLAALWVCLPHSWALSIWDMFMAVFLVCNFFYGVMVSAYSDQCFPSVGLLVYGTAVRLVVFLADFVVNARVAFYIPLSHVTAMGVDPLSHVTATGVDSNRGNDASVRRLGFSVSNRDGSHRSRRASQRRLQAFDMGSASSGVGDGLLVTNGRSLLLDYYAQRTWFSIDLFAAICPGEAIFAAFLYNVRRDVDNEINSRADDQLVHPASTLLLFFFVILPCALKCVKLVSASRLGDSIAYSLSSSHVFRGHNYVTENALRVLGLLLFILLFAHVAACGFYVIARFETWYAVTDRGELSIKDSANSHYYREGDISWVHTSGLVDAPFGPRYITALYWALVTITSTGYGDVTAVTFAERVYNCIICIMGALIYATIFGRVTGTCWDTHCCYCSCCSLLFPDTRVLTRTHIHSHVQLDGAVYRRIPTSAGPSEPIHGRVRPALLDAGSDSAAGQVRLGADVRYKRGRCDLSVAVLDAGGGASVNPARVLRTHPANAAQSRHARYHHGALHVHANPAVHGRVSDHSGGRPGDRNVFCQVGAPPRPQGRETDPPPDGRGHLWRSWLAPWSVPHRHGKSGDALHLFCAAGGLVRQDHEDPSQVSRSAGRTRPSEDGHGQNPRRRCAQARQGASRAQQEHQHRIGAARRHIGGPWCRCYGIHCLRGEKVEKGVIGEWVYAGANVDGVTG